MTAFTVHTIESAPDASKSTLEAAQKKLGFVPNLYAVLSESPAALETYLTVSGLLEGKSAFSPVEIQTVLLTVSYENACEYCVSAHTALAAMQKLPEDVVKALREGKTVPDAKLEALRKLTSAIVRQRGWIKPEEIDAFLGAGYEKRHLLEVLTGVSVKTLSNYVNHIAKTPLDSAFEPYKWSKSSSEAA